ncbi:MAG: hypothetical protein HYV07_04030 [Deltaproteobacteria bacterium]|nr:hypothetical protein [Deltaproteobacteria bacterium]
MMLGDWKLFENGALVAKVSTVSVRDGQQSKTITADLRLLREIVPGPKGKKRLVFKRPRRAEGDAPGKVELEAPDGSRLLLSVESEDRGTISAVLLERTPREAEPEPAP